MSILSLFSPFAWIRRLISLVLFLLLAFYVYCGYLTYAASELPTSAAVLKTSNTILIIGPASSSTQLSADTVSRLNQAVDIYDIRPAKHVILAGNGKNITFSKEYLISNKIPPSRISILSASSVPGTFSALAGTVGRNRLITVVADALQAAYIENLAADNRLSIQMSPAINSEAVSLAGVGQLAKEASAVAVGKVIGFTRVDWG